MIQFHAPIFAWFLSSFGPHHRGSGVLSPGEGGMPLQNAVGVTVKRVLLPIARRRCLVYGVRG